VKLNMGCGFNRIAGVVNIDKSPACHPDMVFDAETLPWPWETSSIDGVLFNHSLEHMGASTSMFLSIIQELYRVCAPNAKVRINVPHPRHDNFINDPTHVRAVTPEMMCLFDKERNQEWVKGGFANSPLAIYLGVDFVLESFEILLSPAYEQKVARGEISLEEIKSSMAERNNVAQEFRIVLSARK
jgi:predicted SAM-dependent methyltransferase